MGAHLEVSCGLCGKGVDSDFHRRYACEAFPTQEKWTRDSERIEEAKRDWAPDPSSGRGGSRQLSGTRRPDILREASAPGVHRNTRNGKGSVPDSLLALRAAGWQPAGEGESANDAPCINMFREPAMHGT